MCSDIFGPSFNRTRIDDGVRNTNWLYGGQDNYNGTNVVFVNGSQAGSLADPGLFASGQMYFGFNVAPGNTLNILALAAVMSGRHGRTIRRRDWSTSRARSGALTTMRRISISSRHFRISGRRDEAR